MAVYDLCEKRHTVRNPYLAVENIVDMFPSTYSLFIYSRLNELSC